MRLWEEQNNGGDRWSKINTEHKQSERKGEALEQIVESIVKKIEEIDTEIESLVRGGMEGNSVQTMANTYIKNREVISDYVKRFAATAYVLDESAKAMKKIEDQADTAASGGPTA